MGYFTRRKTESVELTEVGIDWLGIKTKWVADREQQKAAWEMYVELVTRVAVQPIPNDGGLLREALTSLYSLFGITRDILKTHGPRVAQRLGDKNSVSFAFIALKVLNEVLRPFLTKWHPVLKQYEATRKQEVDDYTHEAGWKENAALRNDLRIVREKLAEYSELLAAAAGITTP